MVYGFSSKADYIHKMTKQTFKQIKRLCDKGLVDLVVGPLSFEAIRDEVAHIRDTRSPDNIVVYLEKNDKGYYQSSIYIGRKEFRRYGKN